ncbi:MAG: hypothetical protein JWO38_8302 [Gemmataceae bacterium]|nr:hypothetical protein [Gemmataceae bacterium]
MVAEKFQAMVMLGIANSRMKDFFDLWGLARSFGFDGPVLVDAIRATFARRKTPVPAAPPLALTAEFGADKAKVTQWQAFLKKGKLDAGGVALVEVCEFLAGFLMRRPGPWRWGKGSPADGHRAGRGQRNPEQAGPQTEETPWTAAG